MQTNNVMSFLDIIILGAGVYVLYSWYLLISKKEIKQGVLIPKDVDPKKCKNVDGYCAYMAPRTLVLGIMALISGGIGIYQDMVKPISPIVYWIFFALFLGVLFWYGYSSKKSIKDFF